MLNLFAVSLLEQYSGRKFLQLLSDATGNTERTWKNRSSSDCHPTGKQLASLSAKSREIAMKKMTRDLAYTPEEAAILIDRMPVGNYHCSQFLTICTAPYDQGYQRTLSFLNAVDSLSDLLLDCKTANQLTEFKETLLASELLKDEYWRSSCNEDDAVLWRNRTAAANTWEELHPPLQVVTANIMFSMFAQWDLDFNRTYFGGHYGDFPLFTLLLPRLARNVIVDPESGRFMRGNKPAKRNVVLCSTARLLELLAVLSHYLVNGKWPTSIPKVKQMARFFDRTESTLVSWRDETTLFDKPALESIWSHALSLVEKEDHKAGLPSSFLAASLLFKHLVVRSKGRIKTVYFLKPDYVAWWQRHSSATSPLAAGPSNINPFADLLA
jgi:hypothetical protein